MESSKAFLHLDNMQDCLAIHSSLQGLTDRDARTSAAQGSSALLPMSHTIPTLSKAPAGPPRSWTTSLERCCFVCVWETAVQQQWRSSSCD